MTLSEDKGHGKRFRRNPPYILRILSCRVLLLKHFRLFERAGTRERCSKAERMFPLVYLTGGMNVSGSVDRVSVG